MVIFSAQTRTGIGLLGKPPAVKQFPSVESHLGVRDNGLNLFYNCNPDLTFLIILLVLKEL
jgi:hypothetical protein